MNSNDIQKFRPKPVKRSSNSSFKFNENGFCYTDKGVYHIFCDFDSRWFAGVRTITGLKVFNLEPNAFKCHAVMACKNHYESC